MTSQSHVVQPPRLAMWLLTLFALDNAAEHILGDLLEEFTRLASKSGVSFARRWYWRQTFKTVVQLAVLGFRTAPWLTTEQLSEDFFCESSSLDGSSHRYLRALEKYDVYEHHLGTTCSSPPLGIDIGHLITFLLIGFVVCIRGQGKGNGSP